jgi:hypothetical protein
VRALAIEVSVLFVITTTGCVTRLPANEKPAYREPSIELPADPPGPDMGRVVLETNVDPVVADIVLGRAVDAGPVTRRLCTTPCVIDLPLGEHEVFLHPERGDQFATIIIRAEARPALVLVKARLLRGNRAVAGVGNLLFLGGLVVGVVGLAKDSNGLLITGGAAVLLGAFGSYVGHPRYEDASYAQYPLDRGER